MVFLGSLDIDRCLHCAEVQPVAAELELAPGQPVVLVEIVEIPEVQGLGHAGLVGIPEQEVEGLGLATEQVIVDHKGPDQVIGPQQVEGIGHGPAIEHTALAVHDAFDFLHPDVIDEDQEIAGFLEIGLGRKEGRRGDAVAPAFSLEPGESGRKHRSGDAIANRVDGGLAGGRFDGMQRREQALMHVIVESLVFELRPRIDPGDEENRETLRGKPADHRVLLAKIHDVELVDPGRGDQEWALLHRFGSRRVLDQLHQIVFEHYLAGRGGHVPSDLKTFHVGLFQGQPTAAG